MDYGTHKVHQPHQQRIKFILKDKDGNHSVSLKQSDESILKKKTTRKHI